MLFGFAWSEEEGRDAEGRVVRRTTVGHFDDLPEPVEGGVRVGRLEAHISAEVIAPAARVVADDGAAELGFTRPPAEEGAEPAPRARGRA